MIQFEFEAVILLQVIRGDSDLYVDLPQVPRVDPYSEVRFMRLEKCFTDKAGRERGEGSSKPREIEGLEDAARHLDLGAAAATMSGDAEPVVVHILSFKVLIAVDPQGERSRAVDRERPSLPAPWKSSLPGRQRP